MTAYSEACGSFSSLLHWHLINGTRPPGAVKREWTNKEFAGAVRFGITDKAIRNWKSGRNLPRVIDHIEHALFGVTLTAEYATWREDLRSAYRNAAKQPAQAVPNAAYAAAHAERPLQHDEAKQLTDLRQAIVAVCYGDQYSFPHLAPDGMQSWIDRQIIHWQRAVNRTEPGERPKAFDHAWCTRKKIMIASDENCLLSKSYDKICPTDPVKEPHPFCCVGI